MSWGVDFDSSRIGAVIYTWLLDFWFVFRAGILLISVQWINPNFLPFELMKWDPLIQMISRFNLDWKKSSGWLESWGLFLESPETFRAHFGWHNSLCIFKMKASRGTKLCSYFDFYSLYNIWKDQLYRISRPEFYEWLFGPEKFSGLSRNWPHRAIAYGPHSAIFSIVLRAPRVMW